MYCVTLYVRIRSTVRAVHVYSTCGIKILFAAMETRRKKINFKALARGTKLPRAERCRDKLYSVTVLESNTVTNMVKIHHVGYSSQYDEWRPAAEIVDVSCRARTAVLTVTIPNFEPHTFSLYEELAMKIKASLISTRKGTPEVRIEMGFNKLIFDEGLKARGTLKKVCRGISYYTISAYSDLNDLLGSRWFIRGLNAAGDFCYVTLASLLYCLKRRRALYEFVPSGSTFNKQSYLQGYAILFTFIRGDGICNDFEKIFNMS